MSVQEKVFNKKALTAAIEQIKNPQMFLWSLLVGTERTELTSKFEVHTKEAGRYRAPLVSKRSGGILIEKEGFTVSEYEPPMLKYHVLNKAEELFEQKFGETVYENGTNVAQRELARQLKYLKDIGARTRKYHVLNKAEELFEQKFGETVYENGTNVAQRELARQLKYLKDIGARTRLWMLATLVTTGVCPLEDGKKGIKFGNFQKEILSDNAWSKPEADIIGYIKTKQLEIQKKTGYVIDSLVVSPDVEDAILKNDGIREYLKQTNANIVRINDSTSRGEHGGREVMYLPTLGITVYSYSEWVKDITDKEGEEEALFPAKTVIGFKKGSFKCQYGALALRPAPRTKAVLHVSKEVVRPLYPENSEDDLLQYLSAPLVSPIDAASWFCAQVLA